MHPAFYGWWKHRHGGGHDCGGQAHAGCGPSDGWGEREHTRRHHHRHELSGDFGDGGQFGVRRPLRFLAHKLDLDETQVAELAAILNDLKTERAQAAVDDRRTVAAFADSVGGDTFDESKAADAATLRVKSAERLRDAVQSALRRIHALLHTDQRQRLAYLIRTGTVSL
jgi:Spy/CpxP family protein refolding chaperone